MIWYIVNITNSLSRENISDVYVCNDELLTNSKAILSININSKLKVILSSVITCSLYNINFKIMNGISEGNLYHRTDIDEYVRKELKLVNIKQQVLIH